ncbi:ATP-binding cassette domain-containing protein [Bacteroidales bacterium OttesenSCG-928-M11]|nr:ATP-binding cassette domain-containing protein [Bacteroidales bacterium OttesenSCG-928-M11]
MSKPLIHINQLSAGYDKQTVLKDINLTIYENDFLGIIGPNGGGKTTLLKVILGLIKPSSGEVRFEKQGLRQHIGYMPQTNAIDKKFPIIVSEVIESGLMGIRLSKQEKKERREQIVQEMSLQEITKKPIGELSGGQLQRTLLARAIISDPNLLILDEPSSYVDKHFESHFYNLLQKINERTAIVLVSHDIGTIISNVKNIACINESLHYHAGSDIQEEWIEEHLGCPFEVIGHGNIPHRILKKHQTNLHE